MLIFDNRHIFTFLQSIFRKFVYHEMTLTKCRVIATYNDKRHSAMYGDGCQGKVTDMYKSWFCFGIMCGKPFRKGFST